MIYGLFNSDTGVWQCAIHQGTDFDEVGDDSWKSATSTYNEVFKHSTDWLEINEEDYNKYTLGTEGGNNNTGYIRDMQTGECISAPPRPFEVRLANAQAKYNGQLRQLTTNYQNDLANAQLVDGDTEYVLESYQQNLNQIIQDSNSELISIIEAAQ